MSKYATRDTVEKITIPEDWHKLKNFQTVRPLTLEQQVERFQAAGRKINELQGLGVYDFNDNQPLDDELEDPTRDPDFDTIDAAVALRDLNLKRQAEESQPVETEKETSNIDDNKKVNDEGSVKVKEPVETSEADTK